jgi:hypothetical protein
LHALRKCKLRSRSSHFLIPTWQWSPDETEARTAVNHANPKSFVDLWRVILLFSAQTCQLTRGGAMRASQQLLLRLRQQAQTELSGAAGSSFNLRPPWSPRCWVTGAAPAVTAAATSFLHTTAAPALRSSAAPAVKMAGAPIPLTTGRCAEGGRAVQEANDEGILAAPATAATCHSAALPTVVASLGAAGRAWLSWARGGAERGSLVT